MQSLNHVTSDYGLGAGHTQTQILHESDFWKLGACGRCAPGLKIIS